MDTTVFNNKFKRETNTSAIASMDFLSFSSQSYLFVDIIRHYNFTSSSYENATLKLVITPIQVTTLNLYSTIQNFSWNRTISNFELADTKPLWNITNYSYPGSSSGSNLVFPILVASGVIVGVAIIGGAVVFIRKRSK